VRQQLFESLIIATAGGLLGVLAAHGGVQFFARATATIIEAFWMQFEVDGLVLAVSIALTAFAALAAGLAPALQGARTDPGGVLKNESRRSRACGSADSPVH
jgi:ABC-type antimicrobial peptide transport system permease subunit